MFGEIGILKSIFFSFTVIFFRKRLWKEKTIIEFSSR